jgi:FixJ family two-component response regulator
MQNGAFDFIQKPFSDDELLHRIDDAIDLSEKSSREIFEQNNIEQRYSSLTDREREILNYIIEGKSNKYIALDLNVSQRTVEAHRAHIMEKMQTKSLPHLVRMTMVVNRSH